MRLLEIAKSYDGWVRYTADSLRADFDEYQQKEERKWKGRANVIGSRFPIFTDLAELKDALDAAPIVDVDSLRSVHNLTANDSLADIKAMVSAYTFPRDVDRIVTGIKAGAKLPLPIIIRGSRGDWIMAGNTRQAVARVLGVKPKALLVDVKARTKRR